MQLSSAFAHAYLGIRLSDKILSLLRLIAYQTGSEVSYAESGNQLGMNKPSMSYILSERIKKLRYSGSLAHFNFWRNYQQPEIDWLEFENGELRAYEFMASC